MNTLPSFAYDWVGGDIRGLQGLEDECARPAARISDANRVLASQVTSVASAGGWTGQAADAFSNAWDRDSKAGTQLAAAWQKIGQIAATLAGDLASLESALEEAAYELERQGIAIDTATGLPQPGVTAAGNACPDPQMAATHAKLADEYMMYRAGIIKQAEAARTHATNALYTITSELLPNQFDYGQLTNDLDGIRSLWAVPTDVRKDYEEAMAGKGKVSAAAWDELLAKHKVTGYNARLEKSTIEELSKSRAALADAEGKLADAPPESKISMTAAGDADGLGVMGAASKVIRGIPYVGATAGAVIQVYEDREAHESWQHSLVDGVASNGASLAAGVGGAAVVTGITAGVIGGGSFVAVGVGAAAGAVAAIGVGDSVHNLIQENWAQDWHHHGVLDGTVHGVADSMSKTGHDMLHYGDDIKNFFDL